MQNVTEHILARKIPLHAKNRPLFYLPTKSTALDAAIYLDPEHFMYLDEICRNHEKVPFSTVLENDDIVTYSFSHEKQISSKWLDAIHSGISRWKIQKHLEEL